MISMKLKPLCCMPRRISEVSCSTLPLYHLATKLPPAVKTSCAGTSGWAVTSPGVPFILAPSGVVADACQVVSP